VGIISVPWPSFDFDRESMTQLPIIVRQRFPFPGKQGAATAIARADSGVSSLAAVSAEHDLAAAAAATWYRLGFARTILSVWDQRIALADQAIRISQSRYQTGQAPQTDLLRARLRRAQLLEQRAGFAALLAGTRAEADALRGGTRGPADTIAGPLLTVPGDIIPLALEADTIPADSLLILQLAQANPQLQVHAARIGRRIALSHAFSIAARPDFTVTLQNGFRFGGRESFATALLGVSIPLWAGRKQGPAAEAAELDLAAARQRSDDALARLTGDLKAQTATIRALQQRLELLAHEIVPLASAANGSALAQYQVGEVQFNTVLDAADDLYRAWLSQARLLADYGAARARLAAALGEEWYQ
jgi:outer membrane protein TolC